MEQMNKSGLTPSFDKVVVEPVVIEEKSKGGIVLPQQTLDKEQMAATTGRMIACGNEAAQQLGQDGIKTGDFILFYRYNVVEFPIRGVKYWVMKWQNVLGKTEHLPDYMLTGAEASALHSADTGVAQMVKTA